jgi:eukaryotic-like serine/threonine-protein kinase
MSSGEMMSSSGRFQRLGELFDTIVELPAEDRDAAVRRECAGDPSLAAELRALLTADDLGGADEFFSGVVAGEAGALQMLEYQGIRLGPWELERPIGQGGMGTVYLAVRADGAYEARAAVKLVRGGVPSPALAERFRAERQILAGLSHPGVAKLLDGGSTDDGTPYLVMEFIDGEPVTTWCESNALGIEERLRIFLKVCDAVEYAHRELIAHRDLKPSNILVTSGGEPKLLDFGIAKLIDTIGEGTERVTQSREVMTPAYASPEQVAGERASASADLYSLGVLLYELLTGRLPLETAGLTPAQLSARITEDVPPIVSSVVDDQDRRRRLTGDLDAIVSRALRKEPGARYASVEAFVADIRLHLEGLPIRSRHDDWQYRTGKLVRKNAGVVSGSLLMLLLGISFTVNTVIQSRAVGRERDRAEAQRATAERVSGFLEELFTEADPNAASVQDISVRDILDRGASRVLTGLAGEAESRAALATVIGRVYMSLGEFEAAEPLLDSALATRLRMSEGNVEALGEAYLERGALAYNLGLYDEAIELQTAAIDAYRRSGTEGHEVAKAMDWLAVSYTGVGNLEDAERVIREAVALHRNVASGPTEELASSLKSLEDVLRDVGLVDEAVAVGEEALAMSRELFGDDHLEVAHALNQLASSLNAAGRTAEAVPLVEEGLSIRQAAFDGPHIEIAASLGNLANMLGGLGRHLEAIVPRRASVEMLRGLLSNEHPYVAGSMASLGTALLRADSVEAAERVLEQALDLSRIAFGPQHPNVANPLLSLGAIYRQSGRYQESVDVLREAYEIRTDALPEGHWRIGVAGLALGRTLDALERDAEAERYLSEAHTVLVEAFGQEDERAEQARAALHAHFVRRGLTERAAGVEGSPD